MKDRRALLTKWLQPDSVEEVRIPSCGKEIQILNGIYSCMFILYILSVNRSRSGCSVRRCQLDRDPIALQLHCECHWQRSNYQWKGKGSVTINRETIRSMKLNKNTIQKDVRWERNKKSRIVMRPWVSYPTESNLIKTSRENLLTTNITYNLYIQHARIFWGVSSAWELLSWSHNSIVTLGEYHTFWNGIANEGARRCHL